MTIDEAIDKIDQAIASIEAEMEDVAKDLALNAMALIVNRIQQQGIEGRQYSKNKLPEFYFFGRELNAGGKALIDDKARRKRREGLKEAGLKVRKSKKYDEMDQGISYEEWRRANGLQVAHADLTFSGRMWQNLGIIGVVRQGDVWVAVVGGFDKEAKDKLTWNAARFGDFFMVTPDEERILQETFKNKVTELIKSVGL